MTKLMPSSPVKLWVLAGACAALMAGAAGLLARFQSGHRLGKPGLILADVPLKNEKGEQATTNSIRLPERVLEYRSQLWPVTTEELRALPRDTTFGRRLYTGPDGYQVQVSGVLMGTDRTSIHKPEYCLPSQGFRILRRTQRTIAINRPHRYELPVTRLDGIREIRQSDGKTVRQGAVYVYWFLSENRLSNDHFQRMWWLALDLVRTGELQRWAYLSVLGACAPGEEDRAYARLEKMIQSMVPDFQTVTGPAVVAQADTVGDEAGGLGNVGVVAGAFGVGEGWSDDAGKQGVELAVGFGLASAPARSDDPPRFVVPVSVSGFGVPLRLSREAGCGKDRPETGEGRAAGAAAQAGDIGS